MIGNTWHLLFSALFMILARCCQGNMFTLLAFWADIDNFITQDSLSLIKLNYTRDRRKVCKRNKEVTWKRLLLNNFSNKDCTVQMTESSQKVRTRWKLFRQKLVFDFRIFEEQFSIRWFTSSALFDLTSRLPVCLLTINGIVAIIDPDSWQWAFIFICKEDFVLILCNNDNTLQWLYAVQCWKVNYCLRVLQVWSCSQEITKKKSFFLALNQNEKTIFLNCFLQKRK